VAFETVTNEIDNQPSWLPSSIRTLYQLLLLSTPSTITCVPALIPVMTAKVWPGPERKLAVGLVKLTAPSITGVGLSVGVGDGGTGGSVSVGDGVALGIGVSDGGSVAVNFGVKLTIGAPNVLVGTLTIVVGTIC